MGLNQSPWSYYLFRMAGAILPWLPPRFGYWFFERLGDLVYRFSPNRQAVWDNVSHVLGASSAAAQPLPKQRNRIARAIFRNQLKNYYDLFRLPALDNSHMKEIVEIHGLENVEAALSAGKGVIAVGIHLGNVDVTVQAAALRGYPITGVAEHLRPEALYRYLCSLRAARGIKLIPADSLLKPIFRALAKNEIVALVADRDTTGSGVMVDFFGAPARLPDGYVQLALRTGAALLPCFALRRPDNTFAAYIEPPVLVERTGNPAQDVIVSMGRVLRVIERYLAAYPDQWVMFQPIWDGSPSQPSNGAKKAGSCADRQGKKESL